ncbi:MAG: DUF4957 domain-containing protein [Bacteroidales bacterium]|nr:DUF4957 domain-containing protein [Bacteroidales bacterium]
MKRIFKYIAIVVAMSMGMMTTGCVETPEIVESIDLVRCLSPLNLSVKIVDGDNVTFRWDAVKGADQYLLEVYSDKEMTALVEDVLANSDELPVTLKLVADSEYWFRVKASDSSNKLEPSKWAVYDGSVKTYAVKPTVYPAVADRTQNSITVTWDVEAAAGEVDSVKWCVLGSEEIYSRALTEAEVKEAKATITDLEAFTNYVVSVYFKSANRGDLSIWTRSNTEGYTPITTAAALTQAVKDGGNYTLTMEGSPYAVGAIEIGAGFELIGEESVEGGQPVIEGEFHVLNTVADGASFIFKSVELNGAKEAYGFPFQLKNGAAGKDQSFDKIHFIGCKITGYSKGLMYEWGGTFKANELVWDGCTIVEVNKANIQGGDGIDFRGASDIKKLHVINSTIYNGFRTFFRIDAPTILGEVKISNNTIMNLSKDDSSTNNNGILGVKAKPASMEFKNNLILYMEGNAKLNGPAAANLNTSDLGIVFASNYFYGITAENFFNDKTSEADALAGGGRILEVDPCYKAKAGIFNVSDTDIISAKVGAPKWLMAYNKKPEDLTMTVIEGTHNWDFTNPQYFLGSIDEKMVRDQLFMGVIDNKLNVSETGIMQFLVPTTVNRAKLPLDGYLAFLVDKPGSVYVKPVNINDVVGNHVVIGMGDAEGKSITIKGGAAANTDNDAAQKIVIRDITGPSLIYVYASGAIGLEKLGWAYDTTPVNTALPSPEPAVEPAKIDYGQAQEAVVTWDPVDNAGSYSVVFSGKTYPVEEGTSYTISSDVVKFLDAGSYKVEVYANPAEGDVYNTQSAAGVAVLTIAAKAAEGGSEEFVVSSAEDLLNAISSGKSDITLAYSSTPYVLGTVEVTSPLRLKGQKNGDAYTPVVASFKLTGNFGALILRNLDFDGTDAEGALIVENKEATADEEGYLVKADTVAIYDSYIHDGAARLYDNSGKVASCIQNVIFDGIHVDNYSLGNDMIDYRAGHYHKVVIVNSTFSNCARTFIRTDAGSEINYLTVRNNTFYKVCTNSSSKDNNGLFHVRSTAGSGLIDYRIVNNLFYSILIDETPSNENGYPKFISKSSSALKPNVISNNYFYNIEEREDKAGYSWWTVNCSREEGLAGGGAVLPADPCKDAANGDFTLVNAVAMNSNIGAPCWNPMRGSNPTSEITVENVNDLLTAISAGKSTITLKAGTYDMTAVTDVAEVSGGVLSVTTSLNLVGEEGAVLVGGFKVSGNAVNTLSLRGLALSGGNSIQNMIEIGSADVAMTSVVLKNNDISEYKNRLFYMSQEGAVISSYDMTGNYVHDMGTSGDFFDVRKGGVTAIKMTNNTFANGIRTFMRIDAAVLTGSIKVQNNTFYNLSSVDSKDNNGIFHVRATAISPAAFEVTRNLFASMPAPAAAPSNANGYPKLVSTNSANIIPTFSQNYYYGVQSDAAMDYCFWTKDRITQDDALAGYGVLLSEDPFKDAANCDFTLVNALAMSERIGDQYWNPNKTTRPDDWFAVANIDEFLLAIDAGKTNVELAYGVYDFTAVETLDGGKLVLTTTLNLKGKMRDGKKPEVIGAFKFEGVDVAFSAVNIDFNGNDSIDNMMEVTSDDAVLKNVTLRACDVRSYKNRFFYMNKTGNVANVSFSGLMVKNMGTGGDFIDIRKGTANVISVKNSTFANGIRTFARVDAAVVCGAMTVENNTFYNLCSPDSTDVNGILHVRSTSLSAANFIVKNNIFASMHRAEAEPTQTNGYPKLVSTNAASQIPTFIGNIFYDVEDVDPYSWWTKGSHEIEAADLRDIAVANGGALLTESPFTNETPGETLKFNVKVDYKGIGDPRW